MTFEQLGLAEPLLRALAFEGYHTPTPIQAQAIPVVLAGRDVLGCAQTGTGKTAAFALPILHRLREHHASHGQRRSIRTLVLSPTRELTVQIAQSFRAYGRHTPIKTTTIFGGVGQQPQVDALKHGIDIVVATPGRLLDLMNQGFVDLRHVEVFVLDEADRMLDMGFIHDIRRIIPALPPRGKRQTLLFSATMPSDIRHLAHDILHDPATVQVTPVASTAEKVRQSVYFVDRRHKAFLLAHLLKRNDHTRALVFTRTKHGADKLVKSLYREQISAEAIHGNKSQNARQRALGNFREGKTTVLIASDIAARGIDIDDISHVINFDLPNVPETYVHRIGRTARAGAAGLAVSFCDHEEKPYLRDIEQLIRQKIEVATDLPEFPRLPAPSAPYAHPPASTHRPAPHGHGQRRSSSTGGSGQSGRRRRRR